MADHESTIDDYDYSDQLGEGAFGEVYLANRVGSTEKLCMKLMDKGIIKMKRAEKFVEREIEILKEVNHPNIIKLVDNFLNEETIVLIFELCNGGSLDECLKKYREKNGHPFTEEIVQYLMKQIVEAIKYLHGLHILHRDLKLCNIMVNFKSDEDKANLNMLNCSIKLIDFGFARHLKVGEWATSNVGSLPYKDPHLLDTVINNPKMRNQTAFAYDEKIDIWSLGVLCYELLVGEWTFKGNEPQEMIKKVQKGDFILPSALSKETLSFINSMLRFDYELRPSAKTLLSLPFLTKSIKDFTPLDINKAKKKMVGDKIKLNAKLLTQSVFVLLDDSEESNDKEDPMYKRHPSNLNALDFIPEKEEEENGEAMSYSELLKEYKEVFQTMNRNVITTAPRLLPVIPGYDPLLVKDYQ